MDPDLDFNPKKNYGTFYSLDEVFFFEGRCRKMKPGGSEEGGWMEMGCTLQPAVACRFWEMDSYSESNYDDDVCEH